MSHQELSDKEDGGAGHQDRGQDDGASEVPWLERACHADVIWVQPGNVHAPHLPPGQLPVVYQARVAYSVHEFCKTINLGDKVTIKDIVQEIHKVSL